MNHRTASYIRAILRLHLASYTWQPYSEALGRIERERFQNSLLGRPKGTGPRVNPNESRTWSASNSVHTDALMSDVHTAADARWIEC